MHVGLLRGINVGGKRLLPMADLRALMLELGFPQARSLLQTGNLIFNAGPRGGAELERFLESETLRRLGLEVDYFVRDATYLTQVVAHNPFAAEAERDPARLVVTFLKASPSAQAVAALQTFVAGPELAAVRADCAYVFYPAGIGTSKITHAALERRLGTRGTGRNWNTVVKLLAAVRD